jgi:hypothetical protein
MRPAPRPIRLGRGGRRPPGWDCRARFPGASGRTPTRLAHGKWCSSNCGPRAAQRPAGVSGIGLSLALRSRLRECSLGGTATRRPGARLPPGRHARSRRSGPTCCGTVCLRLSESASTHTMSWCEAVRYRGPTLEGPERRGCASTHATAPSPVVRLGSGTGAPPEGELPPDVAPSPISPPRRPARASAGTRGPRGQAEGVGRIRARGSGARRALSRARRFERAPGPKVGRVRVGRLRNGRQAGRGERCRPLSA